MKDLIAPIIFDMTAETPDLTGFRGIDIQTWQTLSAAPSKNQPPASLDHLVSSARNAGLHVIDVVALRRGVAVERSVWLFLGHEHAARFLSDVSGRPVEELAADGIDLERQFTTDLFGPSIDAEEKHIKVTCQLRAPATAGTYQPALFDIAA